MTTERQHHQAGENLADVRSGATETGRVNQKLRTRQALIEAARDLVGSGATPTLAEVAEHALVSKTTAYRYFESADALIAEVYFDRDFPTVDGVLGSVGDDPAARILAVEAAFSETLLAQERAMRIIVRNALDTSLSSDDAPARPGRRLLFIEAATEPLVGTIEPATLQRLRQALTLVIGPEAIIAARDVCGLDPEQTRAITRWATEALISHALSDTQH